jgi:transposase
LAPFSAEFLDFLNLLVRTYPRRQIHVVLEDVSSHKTPEVQQWLRRHKRFHFHFTPTSASWMNQIETWFGSLTRQAIRRGTFDSVKALVAMIEAFTRSWNEGASPFHVGEDRRRDPRQGGAQAPGDFRIGTLGLSGAGNSEADRLTAAGHHRPVRRVPTRGRPA